MKMLGLMGAILAGLFLTHGLIEAQARADRAKTDRWSVESSRREVVLKTKQLADANTTIATLAEDLATAKRKMKETDEAVAFLVRRAEADMRRRR